MLKNILKFLGIIALVLVTLAIGFIIFTLLQPKPDVSAYKPLIEPKISSRPSEKMIQVTVSGEPGKNLPQAFTSLFGTYFSIKDAPKGPKQPAPRLRMKSEGIGSEDFSKRPQDFVLGLPIPEDVTTVDAKAGKKEFPVEITTWEYGEVAEILHMGSYDKEPPTIKKLLDFIDSSGYKVRGIHEEEYIIGPGMLFAKPEEYVTVIRYPVDEIKK
jgi:hypothetical protein